MSPDKGGSSSTTHRRLGERAIELLSDREWHPYEPVLRDLSRLVPPGVAIRKSEAMRKTSARLHNGPAVRKRPRPVDELIRSGARAIVRDFLRTRTFEIDGVGPPGGSYTRREREDMRRIRLVGMPRSARTDPVKKRADRLEYELTIARDQLMALAGVLVELGHGDDVKRLAPSVYDDHSSGSAP
jgi:hypothetical protein